MKTKIDPELEKNLLADYIVLFSPKSRGSLDDINGLNPDNIKDAFRSRALESHPDRAEQLGIDKGELTEKFKEITRSYTRLLSFVEKCKSDKPSHSAGNTTWRPTSPNPREQPDSETDENEEMLFGQFLYYKGRINFKTLLDAVYWQRKGRAMYGTIAYKWKLMSKPQIVNIMKQRDKREKFGECAIRLGYLSETQNKAILYRQRQLQRPIGEYFVLNSILSLEELNEALERHKIHRQFMKERRKKFG